MSKWAVEIRGKFPFVDALRGAVANDAIEVTEATERRLCFITEAEDGEAAQAKVWGAVGGRAMARQSFPLALPRGHSGCGFSCIGSHNPRNVPARNGAA